jgi:hypothetical protein
MSEKQVNLLQFRTVNSAVKKYMSENSIEKQHLAFLGLVLSEYLGLNEAEIEDSIIEGSLDGGIDAIYIKDEEERPIVYLVQSKFYNPEKDNKFDRSFEGVALTKMKEAIDDFIFGKRTNKAYQNKNLQNKLKDITQLENPKYKVLFCSNSDHPALLSKKQFEDFLEERDKNNFFEVIYLHLTELSSIFAPFQKKKIDCKIKFIGKFIDYSSGDVRMFLGQVSTVDIAKLREEKGTELFDRNVRGFLGIKNSINNRIQHTLSGEDCAYFVYFNNGITITCDHFTYSPVNESPLVEMKNIQIVNGGQTTNSIHTVYKKNELKDSSTILVRVLETQKSELLPKIILSTNSQTKITSRDLRSNDEIQKCLEREIYGYGYYYEARKGKYKDNSDAGNKRVDAEIAAQAYVAAIQQHPADAKNKKALLFGEKYDEIFNNEIKGKELLNSFIAYKKVREINKEYKDKYTFVNDSALHTVAMLSKFGDLNSIITDEKKFRAIAIKILNVTKNVVKECLKEQGDKYSHRKLFIDTSTIGRLIEEYEDKYRKS